MVEWEDGPVKRTLAALATATLLIGLLPATVSADRVSRYTDHHIVVGCDGSFDGGSLSAFVETSTAFGDYASVNVWLDPADPFEGPASASGETGTVQVTEGAEIVLQATIPVADPEGAELGVADLVITMMPDGEPTIIGPYPGINHKSKTQGTSQHLEGSGTITMPGLDPVVADCSGDLTDVMFFEANPRSYVSANTGVGMTCLWTPGEGTLAGLDVYDDTFGLYASAFLITPTLELGWDGVSSGSIDATSMSATVELEDTATGDPYTAVASASLTPNGSPFTSILLSATARTTTTEQALTPDGSLVFSTGDSFVIDEAHCDALTYDNRSVVSPPAGPKSGPVPVNDTPDGAIAVTPGTRLNAQTVATSYDPEVPISTCPQGFFDDFGRTLWYTIDGTGGPVTIDTAGSNMDTLIGVYVRDGEDFVEVACNDDVEYEPVGATLQAAVTLDATEEGTTYHVQVGGYRFPFGGDPQIGRLRLSVD